MTVTFTLTVLQALQAFGYEDRSENLAEQFTPSEFNADIVPNNFEHLDPEILRYCAADAESESLLACYHGRLISAVERAFEAIDGTTCSYSGCNDAGDLHTVNVRANFRVSVDKDAQTISVTATNLHHFVNAMVDGLGAFPPILPTDKELTEEKAVSEFVTVGHLFFDVYGRSKPEVDTEHMDSFTFDVCYRRRLKEESK